MEEAEGAVEGVAEAGGVVRMQWFHLILSFHTSYCNLLPFFKWQLCWLFNTTIAI